MSYACRLASIDEPALRLEHLRVRTRYHQNAIDSLKRAIQCFGARHIPFDEFDIWQFREPTGPRPIAHQCAHRYAVDRKSTRLNSSHLGISYAVFCLKKKKQ